MYEVTYVDTRTMERKNIKLISIESVRIITSTLDTNRARYEHVEVRRIQPRRVRELVIIFEK
jgi:hypothetical protein